MTGTCNKLYVSLSTRPWIQCDYIVKLKWCKLQSSYSSSVQQLWSVPHKHQQSHLRDALKSTCTGTEPFPWSSREQRWCSNNKIDCCETLTAGRFSSNFFLLSDAQGRNLIRAKYLQSTAGPASTTPLLASRLLAARGAIDINSFWPQKLDLSEIEGASHSIAFDSSFFCSSTSPGPWGVYNKWYLSILRLRWFSCQWLTGIGLYLLARLVLLQVNTTGCITKKMFSSLRPDSWNKLRA